MNLNSTVRFTADGTVSTVNLTYDVLPGDEIQVFFGDQRVLTGWELESNVQPQRVQFDTNIPDGTEVLIRRYTDMRDVPHVFHFTGNGRGGAEFNARNMDENFDKIKRASQDAMDSFELIGINLEAAEDAANSANEAALSASNAFNSAAQANIRANAAQTSAADALGYSNTAEGHADRAEDAFDAVEASAIAAGQAADRASDSEDAADLSAISADQDAQAAASSASTASSAAVTAGNRASDAATSALEASGYANTAGIKANEAIGAASAADTHSSNALGSASDAAISEGLAQKWATNPEDQAVESGQYSAMHWALKAQTAVITAEDVITDDTSEIKFTGAGSIASPLAATIGVVDWSKVTGKPSSYIGDWDTLLNKPTTYPSTWASVSGKPPSYPSSWSQVSDKPALASATHVHTWADIYDTPSTYPSTWASVSGKPSTFTPSTHSHTWASITSKPSVYPTNWANVSGKPVNRAAAFIYRLTDWGSPTVPIGTDINILRGNFTATPSGTGTFLVPLKWVFYGHEGGTVMQATWIAKLRTTSGGAVSGQSDHLHLLNYTAWGGAGDADVRSALVPVQWTGLTPNATYRFDLDIHFGAGMVGCSIFAVGTRAAQIPDIF